MAVRAGKVRTVADLVSQVRELKERASVNLALVGVLRTRYLPRDSMATQSQISCDGSPVSERVIDELAAEFEEQAKDMIQQAELLLSEAL